MNFTKGVIFIAKLTIIGGAGTVGAAAGFMIALKQLYEEVCFIDMNEKLLHNHLMDISNAVTGISTSKIYAGTYEDMKGSKVVLITASIPNRNVTSRLSFLEGNLPLMDAIGENIQKYAPNARIVVASNPTDLLTYYLYKKFGFRKNQIIGYNFNDSKRFEWAVRGVLSLNEHDTVFSPAIGEHGSTNVLLFSHIKINGKHAELTLQQKREIEVKMENWFSDFNRLGINRTTGWTSSVGLTVLMNALNNDEDSLLIGSAVLSGEYGIRNMSIGVPLIINESGIKHIEEWQLSDVEYKKFKQSAETLKAVSEQYGVKN